MNRYLTAIPAIVLFVTSPVFTSCKGTKAGDTAFAKNTFESLARGDLAVVHSIDWETLQSLGIDVGKQYVVIASEEDKRRFREGFVTQFASSFQSTGSKVEQVVNWRVASQDKLKTVISADAPGGTLSINVTERDGQHKVSSLQIVK